MTAPTPEQLQQGEQDLDGRLGPGLQAALEELEPWAVGPEQWLVDPDVQRSAAEQYRRLDQRLQILRLVWWKRRHPSKPLPRWRRALETLLLPPALVLVGASALAVIVFGTATICIWAPLLAAWLLHEPHKSK